MAAFAEGSGPPPDEYLEARVVEKFGWTFTQLDVEDEGRTLRAMSLLNMMASYQRVVRGVQQHAPEQASEADYAVFQKFLELDKVRQ